MMIEEWKNHVVRRLDRIKVTIALTSSVSDQLAVDCAIDRILEAQSNENMVELLLLMIEKYGPKHTTRSEAWEKAVWFVAYETAVDAVNSYTVKDWAHLFKDGMLKIDREDIATFVRVNFLDLDTVVEAFFKEKQ